MQCRRKIRDMKWPLQTNVYYCGCCFQTTSIKVSPVSDIKVRQDNLRFLSKWCDFNKPEVNIDKIGISNGVIPLKVTYFRYGNFLQIPWHKQDHIQPNWRYVESLKTAKQEVTLDSIH